MEREYETVIGLEVHVELSTKTKIFCGCSTAFGGRPNTQVCPVCLGMPGALPVLNRKVVEYAASLGLATNCSVARHCRFDRKNYFYPDNPRNYQISQLYLPICREGYLDIPVSGHASCGEERDTAKRIRIHEIHMEEDAGKLIHDEGKNCTLIDYNRAGVPLLEIVTEPDLRSAQEVIAFLEKLRLTIQYLGISDCKLQEGSMRVDVNLSVREAGTDVLGTRTEMKNLGSFRAVSKAIEKEGERQAALIESGMAVVQETRRWDEKKENSYAMRSKEDARDYRYFPDPDLPPVYLDEEGLEKIRAGLPEFAEEKRTRYREEYGIPEYDIGIITDSPRMADIFETAVALGANPKKVSNWLMGETLRLLKEKEMDVWDVSFSPEHLVKLIALTESGAVNSTVAKEVFEAVFTENAEPEEYVRRKGLGMVEDMQILREAVEKVIEENAKSVRDYRGGKERALGYLVGQTMKALQGRADPDGVRRLLKELL